MCRENCSFWSIVIPRSTTFSSTVKVFPSIKRLILSENYSLYREVNYYMLGTERGNCHILDHLTIESSAPCIVIPYCVHMASLSFPTFTVMLNGGQKNLSLNSVRFRRLVTDLSTVHSSISGNIIGSLSPYLNHIPPSNTRGHNLKLEMPVLHYFRSSQNIISKVASIWNTLPQSVLKATSSASFRRLVSHYLKTHSLMD